MLKAGKENRFSCQKFIYRVMVQLLIYWTTSTQVLQVKINKDFPALGS